VGVYFLIANFLDPYETIRDHWKEVKPEKKAPWETPPGTVFCKSIKPISKIAEYGGSAWDWRSLYAK
jgi:hypothetical protein